MRTLVNSLAYRVLVFLNKIFGWDGKKLFATSIRWFSHSGNGYYPLLPLAIYWWSPPKAPAFLYTAAGYPDVALLIARWIEEGRWDAFQRLAGEGWGLTEKTAGGNGNG